VLKLSESGRLGGKFLTKSVKREIHVLTVLTKMELIVDHSSVFSAFLHFLHFLLKTVREEGQELTNSETGINAKRCKTGLNPG